MKEHEGVRETRDYEGQLKLSVLLYPEFCLILTLKAYKGVHGLQVNGLVVVIWWGQLVWWAGGIFIVFQHYFHFQIPV